MMTSIVKRLSINDQQDFSKDQGRYGTLPMNQSQERTGELISRVLCYINRDNSIGNKRTRISDLKADMEGQTVVMQARIQSSRATGKLAIFISN